MPDAIEQASVAPITDADLGVAAEKSGDTSDHIKDMLEKADSGLDTTPKGDKEQLLAGKYKSNEDLDAGLNSLVEKYGKEKAYKILEGELGKTAGQDPAPDNKQTDGDALTEDKTDALSDPEKAAKEAEAAGKFDIQALNNEYQENGELSAESYKKLADAGFDQTTVDAFIEGQEAKLTLFANEVTGLVGGEQNYNTLVEWAGENLSEAEKLNFNRAIESQDMTKIPMVMDALKSRYEKVNGSVGTRTRVEAASAGNGTMGGYENKAQMTNDMRDPRYKTDAAFRKSVMDKVKRTTAF
jgi:hypothetical protein